MFIKKKEFEATHSLISMKKIGVIGLGNMGSAVAKNILRANFPLSVYDIRREASDKLVEAGAVWKNSPKELINDVDIVVSMVFGPKEIEAVMKNDDGILQGNCNQKGWIDLTTSSPTLMRKLAKEFESLGGLEKLIETFKERLEEQKKKHKGGNKWIGTEGTSPFGNDGYNPEGIRIGGDSKSKRAVKVWDRRDFKNYDDGVELGTRNIKVALRRLRKFARTGAADELDLDDTISSTARNAGMLDIKMVPERHNAVKVLLFLDVGGSMDPHIKVCEELFSAAHTEFKHLEYFYFHNFVYESVWKNNIRRHNQRTATLDLMHKYGHDYKVVIVGDASMSPYEIVQPGGSVEHWNEEAGELWLRRLRDTYSKCVWLNPVPKDEWQYTQSIGITNQLMEGNMFPLTLSGLEDAMGFLAK